MNAAAFDPRRVPVRINEATGQILPPLVCEQCGEPTDELAVVYSPKTRDRSIEVCGPCAEDLCDDHGWRAA